mmetsp:Transcript_69319/g.129473  ORF Transcript_69319/g.129473 Transcript_69319/m.129473 type:complete len:958 (+) Transcript_69319:48-2921(+)
MASPLEPGVDHVVQGIRVGNLVQLHGLPEQGSRDLNNLLGQVVSCISSPPSFNVSLLTGESVQVEAKNVRVPTDLQKPGEGGGDDSFDMVLGPGTVWSAVGDEIKACFMEKGFCVLKVCESSDKALPTLEMLRGLAADCQMERLAEEVEEGYLGQGCSGKVMWLDFEKENLASDPCLSGIDQTFAYLAQVIQPHSEDVLGYALAERTPSLICLTLQEGEDAEFPYPIADDKILGEFLGTWHRTLVKAVQFVGPAPRKVALRSKDGNKGTTSLLEEFEMNGSAGTILLFRPDCYEYSCEAASDPYGEALMLISHFCLEKPLLVFSELQGELAWLSASGGPPAPSGECLAVMNCVERLPANIDSKAMFTSALFGGTDCVTKIPLTRWDVDQYYVEGDNANMTAVWPQTHIRHQGYMEGCEMFDHRYFEISTSEALGMDPVQRMILETSAQSLAMEGLTKKGSNKPTHAGVCVGNDKLDWMIMAEQPGFECSGMIAGTAVVLAIIANRVSFVFNLKGPSFVADTACSASLTSTHAAKGMLKERKADPLDFFLTLGAHLLIKQGWASGFTQSGMGSFGGRCFTFNASATGYLRGEGCSGFLMKYGEYAEERLAVLRATACGQDGRSASLTAPNGPAQVHVITAAVKESEMTTPEATVWECHGTGTALGDPIEVGAVRKVQTRQPRLEPLMLGSVKSNYGHMEGGAAMGGMCKCLIQVSRAYCAPTQHLRVLNAHLEHEAFDAVFETEAAAFPYRQGHSQVSSFGFGGTNGHAIFWGESHEAVLDNLDLFHKRLRLAPPPEVRPTGSNPDDWDHDYPDFRDFDPKAKYIVQINPDDPITTPLRWVKQEGFGEDPDEDVFYSISGNFNNWGDERMFSGDVAGLHVAVIDVPTSGIAEFRFLKNGDQSQVIGPATAGCSRKSEEIVGPLPDLTNSWIAKAAPSSQLQVEFFVQGDRRTVLWLKN